MRKLLLLFPLLLLAPLLARADEGIQGFCEDGGQVVVTSGLNSTTQVQASYPQCQVSVLIHGGGAATIYSDNAGTVLSNPFTASTNGQWQFYVPQGRYDVVLSGAGLPSTVTFPDVIAFDPAQFGYPQCALSFSTTPVFNAGICSLFSMTLSGSVAASNITGALTGQEITISLCQNSAGGNTFIWPSSFLNPPAVSIAANACAQFSFVLLADGKWHHTATGESQVFTSIDSFASLNGIQFTDQQLGADCGAKINAAVAQLSPGGEVWINNACMSLGLSTPVVLSQNLITLRFTQAGTLNQTAAITISGNSDAIIGLPVGAVYLTSTAPVVIQQASGANLPEMILVTGANASIRDIELNGNKASNPSAGPAVVVTGTRLDFTGIIQNSNSHGIMVGSRTTPDLGQANRIHDTVINYSGGSALYFAQTVDQFIGPNVELENSGRYCIEGYGFDSTRAVGNGDCSGGGLGGIYISGSASYQSDWGRMIGWQFGANLGPDIDIENASASSGNPYAIGWQFIGNTHIGLGSSATSNTIPAVKIRDNGYETISDIFTNNNGPTWTYGIDDGVTTGTEAPDQLINNIFYGTYGTGYIKARSNSMIGPNVNGAITQFGFPNNAWMQWSSSTGVLEDILELGSDNNTYLNAITGQSINLQINNTTIASLTATTLSVPNLIAAGTGTFGGNVIIPNNSAYEALDTTSAANPLLKLGSDNNTYFYGQATQHQIHFQPIAGTDVLYLTSAGAFIPSLANGCVSVSSGELVSTTTICPLAASLTTSSGTTDNVTITGMTALGHCELTATNASAATNIATTYVSAKTTNQITITHTGTSGMLLDILCTPN